MLNYDNNKKGRKLAIIQKKILFECKAAKVKVKIIG